MSTPDITPILEQLAAGRIDAAEAARRIDQLKHAAAPEPPLAAEPPPADAPPSAPASPGTEEHEGWEPYARESFRPPYVSEPTEPPGARPDEPDEVPRSQRRRPSASKGVDRISVRAVGRRVRIVGDPAVATASAEGPHVLRRNGSVLEVSSDGEIGPSLDGFTLLRPPRSLEDLRSLGLGKELFLRVNPDIIIDVEVTAGSLATDKVPYLGKVRVTAGSASLTGVAETNDVLVQAGQATIKGQFSTGRSRVRCESGSLVLHLEEGSNVTVRGDAQLGKVSWGDGHAGQLDEWVLGNGSARLDIGVVMGYAQIKSPGTHEDASRRGEGS